MNQDHGGYDGGYGGGRGGRGGGRGGFRDRDGGGFQRNFGEEEALPYYNRESRGGRGDYSGPRGGGFGGRGDFRGGRGGHGGQFGDFDGNSYGGRNYNEGRPQRYYDENRGENMRPDESRPYYYSGDRPSDGGDYPQRGMRGGGRGMRGGRGGGNYFGGPPRDGMGFGGDKIPRNDDDRRGRDEDDDARDMQPMIIEGSRDRGMRGRGDMRMRGVGRGDMRGGMSERGAYRGDYRGDYHGGPPGGRGDFRGGRGDFSGGFQRGGPDMGGRGGHGNSMGFED